MSTVVTEVPPELTSCTAEGIPSQLVTPLLASISPSGRTGLVAVAIADPEFQAVSLCENYGGWFEREFSDGGAGAFMVYGEESEGYWVGCRTGRVSVDQPVVHATYADRHESFPVRHGYFMAVFWPRPGDIFDASATIEIAADGLICGFKGAP